MDQIKKKRATKKISAGARKTKLEKLASKFKAKKLDLDDFTANSATDSIFVDENGLVAIASVIPSKLSTGQNFLNDANLFSNDDADHAGQIELCWSLYEDEGIVGSTVDKAIDIAISPGTVENVENEDCKKLCEYWAQNLNNLFDEEELSTIEKNPSEKGKVYGDNGIKSLCSDILLHYLVSGDAVTYETWSSDVAVPVLGGGKAILPKRIVVYNINDIEIESSTSALGLEVLKLKISNEIADIVKAGSSNPLYDQVVNALGKKAVSRIKAGDQSIVLPPILTTRFKRRGHGREYGIPFLKRAFNAIASKRRLQALDDATIAGMIQRLTILKLGHPDKESPYHKVQPGRVQALVNMLKKGVAQKMGVWGGPDLDYIDIGPDGKVLSFENRFTEADDGISLALGFPRILIDGSSSGTSSRDWVVLISTITMLERLREMLKDRIDRWLRAIAVKNNFPDEYPKWRWSVMSLKDERTAKMLVVKLFETGLLGYEDSLNMLGFPGDEIITKRIREVEDGLPELLPAPRVAYSPTGGRPDGKTDGADSNRAQAKVINASIFAQNQVLLAHYRGIAESLHEDKWGMSGKMKVLSDHYGKVANSWVKELWGAITGDPSSFPVYNIQVSVWATQHIGKLRRDLVASATRIEKKYSGPDAIEKMREYMAKQEYRVLQFVDYAHKKIDLAKKCGDGESRGFNRCRVLKGESNCSPCKEVAGREYSLSEVLNFLPVHVKCECDIELIEGV